MDKPHNADATDLSSLSLHGLFQFELDNQVAVLNASLMGLERSPNDMELLSASMRAAHSIKGAARVVDLVAITEFAHAMEECLVAAQRGHVRLRPEHIDALLQATDQFQQMSRVPEAEIHAFIEQKKLELDRVADNLYRLAADLPIETASASTDTIAESTKSESTVANPSVFDRSVRMDAEHLDRLVQLAGELNIATRWMRPFASQSLRTKRRQRELSKALQKFRESLSHNSIDERSAGYLDHAARLCRGIEEDMEGQLASLELEERRFSRLASELYRHAKSGRMRPFSDLVAAYPRMIRDLARAQGKDIDLVIEGYKVLVDRDVLQSMDAPIAHLLTNAVVHGVESPSDRERQGKPATAKIMLEAKHSGGMLYIVVSDDGCGVDEEQLRQAVIRRGLATADMLGAMSSSELMEFLLLPGFSMSEQVSAVAGRGVGLDIVAASVQSVRGIVRINNRPGHGISFHLQLPLTLSVINGLLADIGGEPYVFPLARIDTTLRLDRNDVYMLEGRQYFTHRDAHIGLVPAQQLLGLNGKSVAAETFSVVVISDRHHRYGVVVDRFRGEQSFLVQPLASCFGKVQDIAAGTLTADGDPALIIDMDDLLRTIQKLVVGGSISRVNLNDSVTLERTRKRILVVDDSVTVREVERNLLENRGYAVDVAVDGVDGWNAVRTGNYDLVVSDVDMPRMNGIELVQQIKRDARLKDIPVLIVSYKDREEDRQRGLDAGANYYLVKSSFHDETLLDAVMDLIGAATTESAT